MVYGKSEASKCWKTFMQKTRSDNMKRYAIGILAAILLMATK
jgi:hypothetical protein